MQFGDPRPRLRCIRSGSKGVPCGPQRFSAVLEVQIEELSHESLAPLSCEIECEGEGSESISHAVDKKFAFSYVNKHDIELMLPVSLQE